MKREPPRRTAPLVEPATPEDALAFVRELQKRGGKGTPEDKARVADFVDSMPMGQLKSIARRIMMDIMKGPPPSTGAARRRAAPKRRPSAKQPKKKASSGAKKSRRRATRRGKR